MSLEKEMNDLDLHAFEIKDPIVLSLITKIVERSKAGQKEYGDTLQGEVDKDTKNILDYLIDLEEELVDAINYISAAKQSLLKLGIEPKKFKL